MTHNTATASSLALAAERYDPAATKQPGALARFLAHPPRWIWWLLRTFWPIVNVAGWAVVTRYDDVAEVLARHDVFAVPFGAEIARLNDGEKEGEKEGKKEGTPFILGMDDQPLHDEQLKCVMQAFKRDAVQQRVAKPSFGFAQKIVAAPTASRFDAIGGLLTRVPLELCEKYYGVEIATDAKTLQKFAYATLDVSAHLFGPPPVKPDPQIDIAADYIRAVVDHAIDTERGRSSHSDTVLGQLVQNGTDAKIIRAFLMGMIVGFVPTNTIASGYMLEMLLRKPAFMQQAQQAALDGDDDLLKACLFEAMRFMALNPGPFRICTREYTLAADTCRAKTIAKDTKVLPATESAMFDSSQIDNACRFDPHRAASDYLIFGYGIHWCAGVFIAQAQITQTFKALLSLPKLRRAPAPDDKLQWRGAFPDHLFVAWGPEAP
jgi:cytochrome P450